MLLPLYRAKRAEPRTMLSVQPLDKAALRTTPQVRNSPSVPEYEYAVDCV